MKIKKTITISMMAVMLSLAATQAASAESGVKEYIPLGCAVGIQMNTEGVLVVGLYPPDAKSSEISPAEKAGILPGDVIVMLDEKSISGASDFISAASELNGDDVNVTVKRAEKTIRYTVKPLHVQGSGYRLGLWLRDGVSGIGTITFFDPETGEYGALGHSINDIDTGTIMPLGKGIIIQSTIVDVRKGTTGCPGELCGCLYPENKIGTILKNTAYGIFGVMEEYTAPEECPSMQAAADEEIKTGEATIYTNISGADIEEYDVEIIKIYTQNESGRSLMLEVTDPDLLDATGGIVQGMSGSPIIQGGKLIEPLLMCL